jgi:pimeloyl-ACP methyl ester carboxylesterase
MARDSREPDATSPICPDAWEPRASCPNRPLYRPCVIPASRPEAHGTATSADGARIAWYRYGGGERTILFVPTWNLVDARVVGHQVAALESHANVLTYDPRGAGASERPKSGYDFPLHAADALAVLDEHGIERATLVTASRGLNAAVLLTTNDPRRFERLAVVAPYMNLEPDPAPPDPERLEGIRNDWRGFIVPFMHAVFTEPDSADVIAEMIAIGLDATPGVIATQEAELDWRRPAGLLGRVTCPTLVVHGEADAPVPVVVAERIVAAMPNARLELIAGGGHRPDIRTPELVNPLLLDFLLGA